MGRSARRLATLLPAVLCAIWSLLVLPATTAEATTPTPGPSRAAPPHGVTSPGDTPHPRTAPRAAAPEPHFAPTAVVRLPAAVENPVRLPGTPAATTAVPADLVLPARGVLACDPRRERAPPATAHDPRAPRGPPSTRHS
ncbi:hypothetical protein DEJ45_34355 [Streptomyces venezuelae]|uniref:hypothetical protein n=1 Tax=Streptomyces venezuelae TaxID=54571 RepID=UPI00123D6709|nr:hypothetical protein [Streptomyces venezuelae]QES16965.1 hypothetical protein DEJ45_34355 [Streptomyces venezuelae]